MKLCECERPGPWSEGRCAMCGSKRAGKESGLFHYFIRAADVIAARAKAKP